MEDRKKLIIAGLVAALALGVVFALALSASGGGGNGSDDDDDFPSVIWVAIWFGVIVPLLVAKKKEGQTPEQKKRMKIAVALGVILLAAGVVVFALLL